MSYTIPESNEDSRLLFYYDFSKKENYTGTYVQPDRDHSNCLEIINVEGYDMDSFRQNSGQFIGDSSNVTGHFVGGYSSLGANFNNCALKIENSENFTHGTSTFIFSQAKNTKKPEVIFSSFDGDNKGFEFGLNSANKLFMQYKESHGPQMVTFNNLADKKNIYAISIDSEVSQIEFRRWNLMLEEFETKIFKYDSCDCFLSKDTPWYLASGVYKGDEGINLQKEAYKYESYLDRFMYFEGKLGEMDIEQIIKSTYGQVDYVAQSSGSYIDQLPTVGFKNEVDYSVSGITGYVDVITGYSTNTSSYQYTTGQALTGVIESGEYYFDFDSIYSSNDVYGEIETTGIYKEKLSTSTIYNAITGFSTGIHQGSTSWSDVGYSPEPLYFHSGVSGKLYDVYKTSPIDGVEKSFFQDYGFYEVSGSLPIIGPDGQPGYGPTSYTYLGARHYRNDVIETHMGVNLFSTSNFADIDVFSPFEGKPAILASLDLEYDPNKVALYVNGISQVKQPISLVDEECNKDDLFKILSGDYGVYTDEERDTPGNMKLYHEDPSLSLITSHPMIDIITDDEVRACRTQLGGTKFLAEEGNYAGDSLNMLSKNLGGYNNSIENIKEIPDGNFKLFFNGKKLISGSSNDYEVNDDPFSDLRYIDLLSSELVDSSGVYHIEPEFHYDEDSPSKSITVNLGQIESGNYFDINSPLPFVYGSFVSYLNGIRLDPKCFVYHASEVDLIKQHKPFILERPTKIVYNNTDSSPNTDQQTVELFEIPNYGDNWSIEGALNDAGLTMNSDGSPINDQRRKSRRRRSSWEQDERKPAAEIMNIDYEDL
jgi:hypothetical protein